MMLRCSRVVQWNTLHVSCTSAWLFCSPVSAQWGC